jgi:hypothetical protein
MQIEAPSAVSLPVLHVYGDEDSMGYAQGKLLGSRLVRFVTEEMDAYFRVSA